MTNPTLERAARAAYQADSAWDDGDRDEPRGVKIARAVLMAVRDLGGVGGHFWKTTRFLDDDMETFTAMIDAILNDGEGE